MQDKVIVVTGGFGVLGRAVGDAALAAGASVALIGHGEANSALEHDRLLQIGGVDLADLAQTRQALDAVSARFGHIDGLANIAGGFRWQTLEGGDLGIWTEMFRMNLLTAATATAAALPYLRETRGAIVNVAAAPAKNAKAGMAPYAASKAGVLRLTEGAADELKEAGVRVNAILPTIIDTPRNRSDMPKADFSKWVTPDQIAQSILFLLSDEASGVTGAELLVAGRS
ncbi:SDR family NAD(P)-dependent oxidoreductase [Methylocapsa acidiphila]|uniref:SDR family NAD(P)-dependent oxidoreductase n=1 Tax=Methylocapsa acidiphila TaxID=133552 RepID=UPI0004064F5B|nr:SDR family NAD(P)-dependent oxidoreductase [Methylocapsa acidiphila]